MATTCYVPAYATLSFKGRTATCISAEYDGGRRGAVGEFPFGERTAFADLGISIKHFNVQLAFRENSHLADAKAFFNVCVSPGPGTLVHPSFGSVQASCKKITVKDSPENSQGETIVDIEFIEANRWLSGFGFGASLIGINIRPVINAAAAFFAASYNAIATPFYASPSVIVTSGTVVGAMREQLLLSSGIREDDTEFWQVAHDLDSIAQSTTTQSADTVWLGIAGGFAAIDKFGSSPEKKLGAYRIIANAATTLPAPSVGARVSHEAVVASTRILSATYMARAALEMPASTMQDGFALYDSIMVLIADELSVARAACDNGVVLALTEFTAQTQTALLNRIYDLPAVVEYDFQGGVFSIQAAYEIYGDARKFGVIEKYNARQLPFLIGPKVVAPRPTSEIHRG